MLYAVVGSIPLYTVCRSRHIILHVVEHYDVLIPWWQTVKCAAKLFDKTEGCI